MNTVMRRLNDNINDVAENTVNIFDIFDVKIDPSHNEDSH